MKRLTIIIDQVLWLAIDRLKCLFLGHQWRICHLDGYLECWRCLKRDPIDPGLMKPTGIFSPEAQAARILEARELREKREIERLGKLCELPLDTDLRRLANLNKEQWAEVLKARKLRRRDAAATKERRKLDAKKDGGDEIGRLERG
jgi:hypothetical protein